MKNSTILERCKSIIYYYLIFLSHKIIFELEKRKRIDERKNCDEERENLNKKTRFILNNMESAYANKVKMLKKLIRHVN